MKTELLIQLDGMVKKADERVFLLAASNLPWDLDMALLRRLEKRILVPLPGIEAKTSMLEKFLPTKSITNPDYHEMASHLDDYSGSDVKLVCKETLMRPIRRMMIQMEDLEGDDTLNWHDPNRKKIEVKVPPATTEDYMEALKTTKPSPALHQDKYAKWFREYGSH